MLPEEMVRYARACPWTLAGAHPHSGNRIAIASHLGRSDRSDRATATFAEAYAEQNERDHDSLMRAVKDGRVPVQEA